LSSAIQASSAWAEAAPSGWEAELRLSFVASGGATAMVRGGQRGPLAVQRPFFPEGPGVCHVYVLHPPGGLVGGDRLRVGIDVAAGAHALGTTPAATKLYRSTGAAARVEHRITVAGGGALEWLPQETILFDGAIADLTTRVDLDASGSAPARFIGIDMVCFGLPARDERFARGRCRQRLELWRGGRPLAVERGTFDGGAPIHGARWGLGGATVMGTLLAAPAPGDEATLQALQELPATLPGGDLGAATVLGGGAAVACRYLGVSAERGRRFLQAAWAILRPAVIGRAATAPRIWAT
jgi:urease accessory protein